MQRSTKIVATLGPASSDRETLTRIVAAGVNVVRLNFSHGTADDHVRRAELVREVARSLEQTVGIMVDLQGPKIRIGKFAQGSITLKKGDTLILDAACQLGDQTRVGLDYKELPRDVRVGDVLLLDDGRIVLDVARVQGSEVITTVRHGGVLSNSKGINRQGGGLTAPALTAKDMEDIKTASGPARRLPRRVLSQERCGHVHGARAAAGRWWACAAHRQDRAGGGNPRDG